MSHEHHTESFDGTPIAWSSHGEAGDDPGVVLVHGITESAVSWDPVTERLSADHHVVALDLRGHGESGTSDRYDLEAMATDVAMVIGAAGLTSPHLVGHSLGGAVVSAAGGALPVASVVNVDQSLQLAGFQAQLQPVEPMLRDATSFGPVITQIFEDMRGSLGDDEFARIGANRRPDQDVVLAVWEMMFTMSPEEIDAVVDQALAGYSDVPYLSLFGIDPGAGYGEWLAERVPNSSVEVWADHGHYPHLVDPDRFVTTLEAFWAK